MTPEEKARQQIDATLITPHSSRGSSELVTKM
jgi:hypothetical protein